MGNDQSWLMAQRHKLVRTQTSKLCNQWVDSYLFAVVVQQDRMKVPPSMEGQGALGAMMGGCPIPDAEARDGQELIGDKMWQLCGRSKESHHFSDGGGIIWVGRDVLWGLVSGVGFERCLRLDDVNPMVGDCL